MFSITPLTPPEETPRDNGARSLVPAIPDDILPEISRHLSFQDRLKMSLLSKHVCEIIALRITDVVLRTPEQSSALHDYIRADAPGRAPYLRSIRALWSPGSESRYGAYVDMHILGETIHKASHLEELECPAWLVEVISLQDMQAFTRLTSLRLAGWPSKLQDLSSLPRSLRSLFFTTRDDSSYIPSYRPAVSDFLRSISHLSLLKTLLFQDITFQPDDRWTSSTSERGSLPVLSSVINLHLLSVVLPWSTADPLHVVFPNLSMLEIAFAGHDLPYTSMSGNPHREFNGPFALRHLRLVANNADYIPSHWKITRLTLQAYTCDDLELLGLTMSNIEDLVHLTVDTAAARGGTFITFANVMHDMASSAPNLRSLEFVFRDGDFTELLSYIADGYSTTKRPTTKPPLLCLSIRAPVKTDQALWKVVHRRDQFLESACNRFPHLRYIALADVPVDFDGADDEKRHWWRVIRDEEGSLVEVREVPLWEGWRVDEYFRNADVNASAQFAENFVPRW